MAGTTIETTYTYAVIAAMRPAAAKVLFAMLFCPQLHGINEIADQTAMSRTTVRNAMINLEQLGFVCNNGRYKAWILTGRARQLVLGEGQNLPLAADEDGDVIEAEGQNLPLADGDDAPEGAETGREDQILPLACSSSSLPTSGVSPTSVPTPTDTQTDIDALDPADQELIEETVGLLQQDAVKRSRALDAVGAAIAAGWTPEQCRDCVAGWLAYAGTDRGRTIKRPGLVALSRLRECEPAPAIPRARETTMADFLRDAYERVVQR